MERFEFVSDLGEGAYGTVWKALDRELDRMVAMKRFKEAHLDEEVMRLAIREIRLLKASSHPNVVQLYEAFKSKSGRVYMVMELVDRSLTEEIRRQSLGFTPEKLKVATWQLLQATAFLHSNNIIHRDLKPANILLTKDNVIKLCDFGFARTSSASEAAALTQYVVTRWYRPPEVLVGGPYGTPVDVWAIGCLFSEMATGLPLFPGRDTLDQLWLTMRSLGPLPASQMRMLLSDASLAGVRIPAPSELRPLSKRFPEFTPKMMEVLLGCLNPDPAQRLTAQEVLALPYFDDVQQHLEGSCLQGLYDEAYVSAVNNNSPSAPSLWPCTSMCARDRAAAQAQAVREAEEAAAAAAAAAVATVEDSPARSGLIRAGSGASQVRFQGRRQSSGATSPVSSNHSRPSCASPDTPVGAGQGHVTVHFPVDASGYALAVDGRQASDTSKRSGAPRPRRTSNARTDAHVPIPRRQTMDNGLLSPSAISAPSGQGGLDASGRITGPASIEPLFHRITGGHNAAGGAFKYRTSDNNMVIGGSAMGVGYAPGPGVVAGEKLSATGGHAVTLRQRASESHVIVGGATARQLKEVKLQFSSISVGPGGFTRAPNPPAHTNPRLAPIPCEHGPRSPGPTITAGPSRTSLNLQTSLRQGHEPIRQTSFTSRSQHLPHPPMGPHPGDGPHGRSNNDSEPGIASRAPGGTDGAHSADKVTTSVSLCLPVITHVGSTTPGPKLPGVKEPGPVIHHAYATTQRAGRTRSRSVSALDG